MSIKITIGIISYNRKKYIRSLLTSLECVKEDKDIQVVVIDNGSTEDGLIDMLKNFDVIDDLHLGKRRDWINDEYIAKNKMIEMATGDVLFSMQDDRQLIGTPEYLKLYCQDLLDSGIPSMNVDAVRLSTLSSRSSSEQCLQSQKTGCRYWVDLNNHFATTGLFLMRPLKELGPYPVDWPVEKSYWGRSEDVYDEWIHKKYSNAVIAIIAQVPLTAGVWNDSRGGASFIRGNKRYGEYEEAVDESGLYYKMLNNKKIKELMLLNRPQGFVDVCSPIGWNFAKDEFGDQKKYGQNRILIEGPFETISDGIREDKIEKDQSWVEDWLES